MSLVGKNRQQDFSLFADNADKILRLLRLFLLDIGISQNNRLDINVLDFRVHFDKADALTAYEEFRLSVVRRPS